MMESTRVPNERKTETRHVIFFLSDCVSRRLHAEALTWKIRPSNGWWTFGFEIIFLFDILWCFAKALEENYVSSLFIRYGMVQIMLRIRIKLRPKHRNKFKSNADTYLNSRASDHFHRYNSFTLACHMPHSLRRHLYFSYLHSCGLWNVGGTLTRSHTHTSALPLTAQ